MNNLETAIPFMKQLAKMLEEKKNSINFDLEDLKIRGIDIDNSILRINEQIKTAETKYTIAFIGTFKTGKSTIINSLLNLSGSERLSSEFDPDTAKCVRIIEKPKKQDYDAEVIFEDNIYPVEQISWTEAKKYTSQVALDNESQAFRDKAEHIEEVRYYVDSPFLRLCNILDLPGTGTGGHSEHTEVTDRKIMEADCIFWVISTDAEPDIESIRNLEKINTKMLPIINVWQSEQEDIYSELTPEEIKNMLLEQYSAYFASAENPVIYYAKEIDLAQQQGRVLKEEWGKQQFTDKVTDILNNINSGDRMTRIKMQIETALTLCENQLSDLLEDHRIEAMKQVEKTELSEINKIRRQLGKAKQLATGEIKQTAAKVVNDVLGTVIEASDAFIENKMQGTNFDALLRKRSEEKLKKEFEDDYIRIHNGWLDEIVKEYSDNVKSVLEGIYIDFSLDSEVITASKKINITSNDLDAFIAGLSDVMSKDMIQRILPAFIAALTGGILMFIPGGLLAEAFITTVFSGAASLMSIPKDNKLLQKKESIKRQAKSQIKQQRAHITNCFIESAKEINNIFYDKINSQISSRDEKNKERTEKICRLDSKIQDILDFIQSEKTELKKL